MVFFFFSFRFVSIFDAWNRSFCQKKKLVLGAHGVYMDCICVWELFLGNFHWSIQLDVRWMIIWKLYFFFPVFGRNSSRENSSTEFTDKKQKFFRQNKKKKWGKKHSKIITVCGPIHTVYDFKLLRIQNTIPSIDCLIINHLIRWIMAKTDNTHTNFLSFFFLYLSLLLCIQTHILTVRSLDFSRNQIENEDRNGNVNNVFFFFIFFLYFI